MLSSAAVAEPIKLKLSYFSSDREVVYRSAFKPFIDSVNAAANGLIEIPGQWMLEDWEQFAFNAEPAWGFIPENCAKVFDLWWREFEAMHDFGCCFVLTLHPWLSGRPSRVRLLEELITKAHERGHVWFARGHEIAEFVRDHPEARREVNFDW